jgi:hypothetical protein
MSNSNPAYRIGPSDLFTSDDLLADANTLNGQMNLLDNQDFTGVSQSLFDAWNSFLQEWRTFYSGTFGGLFNTSAWNDSNRDQLIQFETRFGTFASDYAGETNTVLPGGVIAPSTGAQDTLGAQIRNQLQPLIPSISMTNILIVAGILAAGVGIYVFRAPLSRLVK